MEHTIFKVMQGIRGNAWNSKEGAPMSRVFHVKSVNVISLDTREAGRRNTVNGAEKERGRGREFTGERLKWERDVPISPSQMLG